MRKTNQCKRCKRPFVTYKEGKYCSRRCYKIGRYGKRITCKICSKKLTHDQFVYCGERCRKTFWDKNDYHLRKKKKYWDDKTKLIKELGGKCKKCGISDIRVLDINHKDPKKKTIPKDRAFTWQRRLKDWKKNKKSIELLCANCHRVHTWKQMGYGIIKRRLPEASKLL